MVFPLQDKYVNLLTDFGFKRTFGLKPNNQSTGSEPNKALLMDFLNTLLPPRHQIQSLSYKSSENLGNRPLDRKAIFDLYCQAENGERFIVEIQKAKQNFFKDRSVFYASFPIQEQALRGEWNFKLAPVYSIGVLDFIFEDHRREETMVHFVELKDQHCQVFYDKLKFVYIELPKFRKTLEELESHQDKWFYLLRHLPELDGELPPFQDPVFLQLFEVAEIANFSPNEQDSYQSSLKYYRDLNNVIDTSWQEGVEQGREQGQRSMIALIGELTRRVGALPSEVLELIDGLSLADLEALGEALVGISELDELVQWLRKR